MLAKPILIACLALLAVPAYAETPQQIMETYAAEAGHNFKPSAARGHELFSKQWGVSADMPSCSTCHTKDIHASGKHAITGKVIEPMAVAANPERFTTPKKVAKWFKRNCNEVLGRECTPAEKADFIQFAIAGGQ